MFRRIASQSGLTFSFVNAQVAQNVQDAIKPNTKVAGRGCLLFPSSVLQLVWIETPTNPLLQVIDIQAVAAITKKRSDITLVVDNTFMSPYFQRPLELGADIVFASVTKYINGLPACHDCRRSTLRRPQ